MKQVIFGGNNNSLNASTVRYESLVLDGGWTATEANVYKLVSADGFIKKLRVRLSTAPGAGKSFTFVLMLNGSPTALSVEIADSATSGNAADEIDVAPGDTVSIRCTPSGTPGTGNTARWSVVFDGDTANESLILGGPGIWALHNTNTEYSQVMCGDSVKGILGILENDCRQVVPTAGTIKDFYVKLTADPGTAPDAYRFTLRLNGATVAQSLIVTITADDTTGSDLVHNLAVVAGDILTMVIEPLNSPSETPLAAWGMTFVADIDGESIILGGSMIDLDNALTEYNAFSSRVNNAWSSEVPANQLGQTCTLKKLYMLLSGSPGAGNKYTFTVRIAGADSNVVVEVADTATTGNSGALEDTVADDEFVSLQVIPDSTPTVRDAYWGLVSFIAAGWAGGDVLGVAIAGIAKING
ncbi:hypothetical protein LCGC14_1949290, partial [marine sediment metagenome]